MLKLSIYKRITKTLPLHGACSGVSYKLVLVYQRRRAKAMARRYLDKKTKERYRKMVRSDDYPKHVTETGPKIPELDDTLLAKRMIYLKDINVEPQDLSETLQEKINELNKTAEETSEYIQHVNSHLEKQKEKLTELKRLQKKL